jgi:TolB protein
MGGRLIAWPGFAWTFVLILALVLPAPANAAFPGQNGKLAFYRYVSPDWDVYVVNPDGTGETNLTSSQTGDQTTPSWSPDGSKIAYGRGGAIWIMNADGSGKVEVVPASSAGLPGWSPDGSKLVFTRLSCIRIEDREFCTYRLYTINADGTGEVELVANGLLPVWSPDGQLIAYDHCSDPDLCEYTGVHTVRPDGSDERNLTPEGLSDSSADWSPNAARLIVSSLDQAEGVPRLWTMDADGSSRALIDGTDNTGAPAWSPDGTRTAFVGNGSQGFGIYVMDADGTDVSFVTTGSGPDWQPIPVNAYPHPKGASPTDVSLVPAYEPCTAPNRTHGPPLDSPSCSPPTQKPGQLTVGTRDANDQPAKSNGHLRINPLRGNPTTPADEADVRLRANITDVRLRSDLSDYTGSLEVRLAIQITDKDNTPHPGGPGPATVQELTHSHPLPCAATADTTIGATCQFDTTVEALVPGAVKELQRGIWQLERIGIHDGAGNLFLTPGVFVP